jgi:hypothetical protein
MARNFNLDDYETEIVALADSQFELAKAIRELAEAVRETGSKDND